MNLLDSAGYPVNVANPETLTAFETLALRYLDRSSVLAQAA